MYGLHRGTNKTADDIHQLSHRINGLISDVSVFEWFIKVQQLYIIVHLCSAFAFPLSGAYVHICVQPMLAGKHLQHDNTQHSPTPNLFELQVYITWNIVSMFSKHFGCDCKCTVESGCVVIKGIICYICSKGTEISAHRLNSMWGPMTTCTNSSVTQYV